MRTSDVFWGRPETRFSDSIDMRLLELLKTCTYHRSAVTSLRYEMWAYECLQTSMWKFEAVILRTVSNVQLAVITSDATSRHRGPKIDVLPCKRIRYLFIGVGVAESYNGRKQRARLHALRYLLCFQTLAPSRSSPLPSTLKISWNFVLTFLL